MRPSTIRPALVLSLLACLLIAGCSGARPLPAVRDSGDRAMTRGNHELARAEFTKVIQRDPTDWRTRVKLAETLEELDAYPEMREHMAVAYELRPEDEEILDLYCRSMLLANDNDTLMRFLRDMTVTPGRVDDYLRLGYYAMQIGDMDEAERALLTGARLDRGQSIEPQMALASFYSRLGDDERALQRLRMALFINPQNEAIAEAIRAYGEIPGPSYVLVPTESVPGER